MTTGNGQPDVRIGGPSVMQARRQATGPGVGPDLSDRNNRAERTLSPPWVDDIGTFAQRATGRLNDGPVGSSPATGRPVKPGPSDFDLNPGMKSEADGQLARTAAVLVPILKVRPMTVLLTQRAAHLPSHPGQIAFPGGKIEPGDGGPLGAALRETEEEIGLSRRHVTPLGYLDTYRTRTNFEVIPVVALVETGFELALDPREVDLTFEVPLAFLMDPENHQTHSRVWQGRERFFYAMPFQDHYIWGATAGMIKNLFEKLTDE